MDSRTFGRSYEDFQPLSDWIREAGSDTLMLTLPGFRKEHLRVNLDNNRNLKISGERPLGGNRFSRFHKEVQIPENCDVNDLRARIENGILYIKMPKIVPWEGVTEQTTPTKEPPPSQDTSKPQDSGKDQMKPTSITTGDVTKKVATSTDAEKQMKEEETKKKAPTDETKKKEEEEKKDETQKTSEGSTEMEASGGLLTESYMHGGLLGLDESRQLVVNLVIGLLVMLALLVYFLQKITSKK